MIVFDTDSFRNYKNWDLTCWHKKDTPTTGDLCSICLPVLASHQTTVESTHYFCFSLCLFFFVFFFSSLLISVCFGFSITTGYQSHNHHSAVIHPSNSWYWERERENAEKPSQKKKEQRQLQAVPRNSNKIKLHWSSYPRTATKSNVSKILWKLPCDIHFMSTGPLGWQKIDRSDRSREGSMAPSRMYVVGQRARRLHLLHTTSTERWTRFVQHSCQLHSFQRAPLICWHSRECCLQSLIFFIYMVSSTHT